MFCYPGEITFITDQGWGFVDVTNNSKTFKIEFAKKHVSGPVPFEKLRYGNKVKIFTEAPLAADRAIKVEKVEFIEGKKF